MEIQLLYWHWLLLGMVLMIAEIFVPSFTILWFGLGAIIVGLLSIVFDLSFSIQMVVWAISSALFTFMWFKFLKPKKNDMKTSDGAREAVIGEAGKVIKAPTEGSRGIVRFVTPVLGDDEWEFITEDDVELGDRVYIRDFSGNTLIVAK